jgi:Ca2+-binding RTX toxin-like protein
MEGFKIMKKLLVLMPVLVLVGGMSSVSSAISVPAECNKTYTNTITVSTSGQDVLGTPGNDLIYTSGHNTRIAALGGDDCIILDSNNNQVVAAAGNDVVISNGQNNRISGGDGNDILRSQGDQNYLVGGAGTDTCSGPPSSTTFKAQCEL